MASFRGIGSFLEPSRADRLLLEIRLWRIIHAKVMVPNKPLVSGAEIRSRSALRGPI